MQKSGLFIWIILAFILSGCKPAVSIPDGVLNANPEPHFFESASNVSTEKNTSPDSQAHAIATQTSIAYPTPLATYLVRSILVTQGPQATQPVNTAIPTATKTLLPTTASTTLPTNTTVPQNTATKTSTSVPTQTATSIPAFLFAPQSGTPVEIQNFVNTSAGCNWQGIAGQVFDKDDTPLKNIVIRAGGTWNGQAVNLLGVSGAASLYGEGGYELVLGTKTALSAMTVWVQLYDLQGKPLSDKVFINTSTTCSKNLILVNFKFIAEGYESYIPLIVQ